VPSGGEDIRWKKDNTHLKAMKQELNTISKIDQKKAEEAKESNYYAFI
jgi:hypothetical protein